MLAYISGTIACRFGKYVRSLGRSTNEDLQRGMPGAAVKGMICKF